MLAIHYCRAIFGRLFAIYRAAAKLVRMGAFTTTVLMLLYRTARSRCEWLDNRQGANNAIRF